MKARTKSVLALIVTLLIGVVIGALTWSTLHNQRIRKIREARNERGGFYSMVESRVAPVDPAVEEDFRRIVESYRSRLHAYYREGIRGRDAILDSMVTDLDTVLTAEQTGKLRHWLHDDDNENHDDGDDDRRR
jgi:hypothetical protein